MALGESVCVEDTLRVATASRAVLRLEDHTTLPLDQDSVLRVARPEDTGRWWLELLRGAVHVISRVPRELGIRTPFVNAAVEGTEFYVRAGQQHAEVRVFDGSVRVGEGTTALRLGNGEAAITGSDGVPRPLQVLRPRDAVQWALYYPPIIDFRAETVARFPAPMAETVAAYRRGDVGAAMGALERVPAGERDGRWAVSRAAMLLTVGRVEQAREALARVAPDDPAGGEALAVESLIALVTGDGDAAWTLAQGAVAAAPRAPAPLVARAYVEQARFDLVSAQATMAEATRLAPDDPLAWARLAELELSLGRRSAGLAAAQRAESLDPTLSRTQSVLGFARLTQMQAEAATEAFRAAIRLDSADPLPRLGLGLAQIRRGALAEGRGQIEIAAGLDPNNALVRSYLGKAYYEEKRDPAAGAELAIAKALDPNDPTPWLYDAIRKQTENRPVEALHDLQRSIELNDNRAVYRSRLLLDQDLATRSSSLARVYDQLDFGQIAVTEASRSLALDPGNWSAHRFLGETYQGRQRVEVARTSELLQAQLWQPLTLMPVQPELLESGLQIAGGAGLSAPSFNEYTPLFEKDGLALGASGVIGSNDTFGSQIVFSGLEDWLSFSFGYFDYSTDGFRENNHLDTDVYDLFLQVQPIPDLSLHLNHRRRRSDEGDLRMLFSDQPSPVVGRQIDRQSDRFGLHHQISPNTDALFSLVHVEREEKLQQSDSVLLNGIPATADTDANLDEDGDDGQLQIRHQGAEYSLLFGAGRHSGNGSVTIRTDLTIPAFPFLELPESVLSGARDTEHNQAYLYLTGRPSSHTLVIGGLSYDDLEDSTGAAVTERNDLSPKFGLFHSITDRAAVRLAAVRTVKRAALLEETLEPTQIAGFNQLYDDFNGTVAELYGAGLDFHLAGSVFAGAEVSRRFLQVPRIFELQDVVDESQREDRVRLYGYWPISESWSLSAEFVYEDFTRTPAMLGGLTAQPDMATEIETRTVPLTVNYFRPSGMIASAAITHVSQQIEPGLAQEVTKDEHSYWLVDLGVGFRLPKRRGMMSLEVNNIFDQEFLYHDVNIQKPEPIPPPFVPERTVVARITLNF